MPEHNSCRDVEAHVQRSAGLMDMQGALRGTMREIVVCAAGTRQSAEKLSKEKLKKMAVSKQDTEKAVAGGEELRSLHLELCNERARTAFLLSNLSTALDGKYALDPDAAGMHSSCSPNYGLASRQRHWQVGESRQGLWQVPAPSVATDDGTCEAMTELMALYDSLSAENAEMREEMQHMTKTRDIVKERCTEYIKELNATISSLQKEVEELRSGSCSVKERYDEQILQQQQQHEKDQSALRAELSALQKEHAETTDRLRTQIDRYKAARAQQDEEMAILRSMQEREEAVWTVMSGLKSQTEEGIAPAVEETKLGQARLQESLKRAELDRSQQASLLHALQAQMSSLSRKITSMEQGVAQNSQLSVLQKQLNQTQAELRSAKVAFVGADQQLHAPKHLWRMEHDAQEDHPDLAEADDLPCQELGDDIPDEDPCGIDQENEVEVEPVQNGGSVPAQKDAELAGRPKRKRKRSEKQNDDLRQSYEQPADLGENAAHDSAPEEDPPRHKKSAAAGPSESRQAGEKEEVEPPSRKLRGRKSSASGQANKKSAPSARGSLAMGRRRSSQAAELATEQHNLSPVDEDNAALHEDSEPGFQFSMPAAEHGSPPVPFGRGAGPSRGPAPFEVWEDPASESPLPPTLRHDGAQTGLAPVLGDASNQVARHVAGAAASSTQDLRASARKPFVAPRSQKDPSSFGIVRNPSAAITSKVLQVATASKQNFRSFSWADKLAATATARAQQRKGNFTKKRSAQIARLGKIEQPPAKEMFPSGLRLASMKR